MKHVFIFFAILASAPLLAQVSGNVNYYQRETAPLKSLKADVNPHEILLSVNGLLNTKADHYVAIFNVVQVGETAEKTDSLLAQRIRKFANAVKERKLDSVKIATDIITFVPKYDLKVIDRLFSKSYNEVPDGFELQKNIIVCYKNPMQLNTIVTAAATAEIYDLAKVDYFVNDVEKLYQKLRVKCLESLKDKMKSYEIVGVKLDNAKRSISEDFATVLPQDRYRQYTAIARPSLKAAKKSVSLSDKISTIDNTPSRYYQAVPFDQFEVVINSVVQEPMIQLTYRINIKFIINESTAEKTDVLFITPNGQLQTIDVTKAFSPGR